MKTFVCFIIALVMLGNAFSQRLDSSAISKLPVSQQEEINNYIQQAKDAKSTAMVMSIGGGALVVGGALLVASSLSEWDWTTSNSASDSKANLGGVLILVGAASALGSIPVFIKVHRKRNAARAILYGNRGVSLSPQYMLPHTQTAGLKLVIPLGK